MTESEYINATNLTKLRIAVQVLADVLPYGPVEEAALRDIHIGMQRLTDALEQEVKTS